MKLLILLVVCAAAVAAGDVEKYECNANGVERFQERYGKHCQSFSVKVKSEAVQKYWGYISSNGCLCGKKLLAAYMSCDKEVLEVVANLAMRKLRQGSTEKMISKDAICKFYSNTVIYLFPWMRKEEIMADIKEKMGGDKKFDAMMKRESFSEKEFEQGFHLLAMSKHGVCNFFDDPNSDGCIDVQEYAKIWCRKTTAFHGFAFKMIDMNDDGKVDKEEFLNASKIVIAKLPAEWVPKDIDDKLQKMFNMMDANEDGSICLKESSMACYQALKQKLGGHVNMRK